jgi:hypothetical protein
VYLFGGTFLIVFGFVSSYPVGSSMLGNFNFPWVRTPFPRGTPLGGNLLNWGRFPFINTLGFGGFFLGPNFKNVFLGGYTYIPGGNPFEGMSIIGSIHAPESATVLGGNHYLVTPQQPSSSMNVEGPQGSSETTKTSYPSQYSFAHTLFPFLEMVDLPDQSRLTNDPISHNPLWPTILGKLLSYISKFDGNLGEDPSTHIITYHLWCSSNSLMDDNVRLVFSINP